MKQDRPLPLRDDDIRAPLHDWLLAQHSDDSDTAILHELKIPRPSARIDIAVVNGELCGFEIKSDVDSLFRLPRQLRAFGAVFDRITVVTTDRHTRAIGPRIPDWWGIVVVSGPVGKPIFSSIRKANINPYHDSLALLHMLSRAELIELLTKKEMIKGLRDKRRSILIETAAKNIPDRMIHECSRDFFKARAALLRHLHNS